MDAYNVEYDRLNPDPRYISYSKLKVKCKQKNLKNFLLEGFD